MGHRQVSIRKYTQKDKEALFALIENEGDEWTYWQDGYRVKYEKALEECEVYLAFWEDTLCGYLRARDDFGFGVYVMDLLVDKAQRGKELGRLLIEEVCKHFPKDIVYVLGDVYPYYEDSLGYEIEGKVYIAKIKDS